MYSVLIYIKSQKTKRLIYLTRVPIIQQFQGRMRSAAPLTQPTHAQHHPGAHDRPAPMRHPRPHHQRGRPRLQGAVGVVTRVQGDRDSLRIGSSCVHVDGDREREGDGAGEELEGEGEVSAPAAAAAASSLSLLQDGPEALVAIPHEVNLAA